MRRRSTQETVSVSCGRQGEKRSGMTFPRISRGVRRAPTGARIGGSAAGERLILTDFPAVVHLHRSNLLEASTWGTRSGSSSPWEWLPWQGSPRPSPCAPSVWPVWPKSSRGPSATSIASASNSRRSSSTVLPARESPAGSAGATSTSTTTFSTSASGAPAASRRWWRSRCRLRRSKGAGWKRSRRSRRSAPPPPSFSTTPIAGSPRGGSISISSPPRR